MARNDLRLQCNRDFAGFLGVVFLELLFLEFAFAFEFI